MAIRVHPDFEELLSCFATRGTIAGSSRIPTILLRQLAVAIDAQHRGIGPMLLDHAFRKALFASHAIAGALLVTDPIDDAPASFYKKFDFVNLSGGGARLYIAMKTLAKAYPALPEGTGDR